MEEVLYLNRRYNIYKNKQEALDDGVRLADLKWVPGMLGMLRVKKFTKKGQAVKVGVAVGKYLWTKDWIAPILSITTKWRVMLFEVPHLGFIEVSTDGWVKKDPIHLRPSDAELQNMDDYNFVAAFALHGDLAKAFRDAYGHAERTKKKYFLRFLSFLEMIFCGQKPGGCLV